jgi:hypothetical protein
VFVNEELLAVKCQTGNVSYRVSAIVRFGFVFRNSYQKELSWSAEKYVDTSYNALSQEWKKFREIQDSLQNPRLELDGMKQVSF